MSQPPNVIIENNSGPTVRADLNNIFAALISSHSGPTRPSYAVAGSFWYNTSDKKWYLFDGSQDVAVVLATDTIDKAKVAENATTHIARTNNPHGVTAAQVGLGNVDNTRDADKPVSTAQQAAVDAVDSRVTTVETSLTHKINNPPLPTVTLSFGSISETLHKQFKAQNNQPPFTLSPFTVPTGRQFVGFRRAISGNGEYKDIFIYLQTRSIGVAVS